MTPKEKAEELVDKMYFSRRYKDEENYVPEQSWIHAKQCSLIAVDEILTIIDRNMNYQNVYAYFLEVKQEIETYKGGEQ